MNASVVMYMSVTPTPPATPTKPPAMAGASPKMSSLEVLTMATPLNEPCVLYFWLVLSYVPSGMALAIAAPCAFAFTTLPRAEVRLGLLVDHGDADREADADEAAGHRDRDQHEPARCRWPRRGRCCRR